MALIIVRHIVRQPVGEARRYLSALAASGGTMLVGVRISGGATRTQAVAIDERSSVGAGEPGWWSAWDARVGIPGAAGRLTARDAGNGETVLEFCGSYRSPGFTAETSQDVFAFRRASALARAYLGALGQSINSTVAA
jgi:hypothetical protein